MQFCVPVGYDACVGAGVVWGHATGASIGEFRIAGVVRVEPVKSLELCMLDNDGMRRMNKFVPNLV